MGRSVLEVISGQYGFLVSKKIPMEKKLTDNLKRIEGVVAEACARRNRSPQDVQLIAVTKTVDTDTIATLLSLGQGHLGESKVQDLIDRHETIHQTRQNHSLPARD